jgi:High potential iron-sulfur protein
MQRRNWLGLLIAGACGAPLLARAPQARAARNQALRNSLKYQDKPKGTERCRGCAHFIAGKSPTDLGSCRVLPGDTEISSDGYCVAFMKKG